MSSNAPFNISQYTPQELYDGSGFHYEPNMAVNSIALALFSIASVALLVRMIIYRRWWPILLLIGALAEGLGYAARVYVTSDHHHVLSNAFLIQITVLIIAPTLFSAANYTILGLMIQKTGLQSSSLASATRSHKWFTAIFCIADITALAIQAAGGTIADLAATNGDTATGTHIMVAGIVIQTISMAVFMFFIIDYVRRCHRLGFNLVQDKSWRVLITSLVVTSIFILTRSVYRIVELAQGWEGYLITHEVYLFILDALPMLLFIYWHVALPPAKHLWHLKRSIQQNQQNGFELAKQDV